MKSILCTLVLCMFMGGGRISVFGKTVRPAAESGCSASPAGSTLLAKRTGRDIWRNLYEFPLIETSRAVDFGELQRTARWREWFDEAGDVRVSGMLPMPRHVLSHRVIHACFYRVDLPTWPAGLSSFLKVLSSEISRYPVSRLTELYLERGE